jgi:hypothetical protein
MRSGTDFKVGFQRRFMMASFQWGELSLAPQRWPGSARRLRQNRECSSASHLRSSNTVSELVVD